MNFRLNAANTNRLDGTPDDDDVSLSAHSSLLLEWLSRLTDPDLSIDALSLPSERRSIRPATSKEARPDDWNVVAHICGHTADDFEDAGTTLPLTAAEIDYFRRNHRGTENHVSRDFLTAQTDLPSPLAELYGLYRHRGRIDAEAALWVAQATSTMRVPSVMADLLAIGGFANGVEYVSYLGVTYSVPCAFDTSAEIDHALREATRRLALPAEHPSHLLKLKPDEIGVLAASIAEKNALSPVDFLEKANLLSEARQDVTRLSTKLHFSTVVTEHDLPIQEEAWGQRLAAAYGRLLPERVKELPEIQAALN